MRMRELAGQRRLVQELAAGLLPGLGFAENLPVDHLERDFPAGIGVERVVNLAGGARAQEPLQLEFSDSRLHTPPWKRREQPPD
ncbi:hypothetical protein D3C83_47040 [compost metagenome]